MSARVWLGFSALVLAACKVGDGTPPVPEGDAQTTGFLRTWGTLGSADGQFKVPIGIAIDVDDNVFVTDFSNARIQKFDTQGAHLATFATDPNPGGLAIDPETRRLYVTHFSSFYPTDPVLPHKVSYYAPDGGKLGEWGATGTADGEFNYPGGIAVGPGGRVYVADQTNHRIQVFDRDGTFLGKWGQYGPALGEFGGTGNITSRVIGPQFVAVDPQGDVYTTEGGVRRVQRFTPDGTSRGGWVKDGTDVGTFGGGPYPGASGPIAVILDRQRRLWIGSSNGRVQQFATDGTFLQSVGEPGAEPGQITVPHGLALDSHGDLYVVDSLNHRVEKFAVGAM